MSPTMPIRQVQRALLGAVSAPLSTKPPATPNASSGQGARARRSRLRCRPGAAGAVRSSVSAWKSRFARPAALARAAAEAQTRARGLRPTPPRDALQLSARLPHRCRAGAQRRAICARKLARPACAAGGGLAHLLRGARVLQALLRGCGSPAARAGRGNVGFWERRDAGAATVAGPTCRARLPRARPRGVHKQRGLPGRVSRVPVGSRAVRRCHVTGPGGVGRVAHHSKYRSTPPALFGCLRPRAAAPAAGATDLKPGALAALAALPPRGARAAPRGARALLRQGLAALCCAAFSATTSAAWSCSDVDAAQCSALGALLAAVGNTPALAAGGGATVAVCTLAGVQCAGANVSAIALPASQLGGTLPAALSALSGLRALDLSNNLIGGTVPPQWASIRALTSLNLSNNIISGLLPSFLGEMLGLQTLVLDGNFFTGAVPASYNRSWLSLSVSNNLLSSASLPAGVCPWACAWDSAFVVAQGNVTAPCATCALSATYTQCASTDLPASAFAAVRGACAVQSSIAACALCLPTIVSIFVSNTGIYDTPHIAGCIRLYSPAYVAEGANPNALRLLSTCDEVMGYGAFAPVSSDPCIVPTSAQLATLVVACTNMQTVCSSCSALMLRIFLPGADASSTSAVSRQEFLNVRACTATNVAMFLAAGMPINILDALRSCPQPPPVLVSAVLQLAGVAAAELNATRFGAAVCAAMSASARACSTLAPTVGSVSDAAPPGGRRRRLLAAAPVQRACAVSFTLSGDSMALAAAAAATLSAAAGSGALLHALQVQGGLSNLTTLSLALDALAAPSAPAAPSTQRTRTIVAAVLASTGGAACVLAAGVLLARRRRRSNGHGDAAAKSSGKGNEVAPQHSSRGGWTALVSEASEVVLGDELGRGGSASVHAALWRGTPVAVKVWWVQPPFSLAARRGAAESSFLREVEILSSLRHPNILAVFALIKRPPMLVMELAAAGSLRDLLRRRTLAELPWTRRVDLLRGVAAGVEFLHAQQPPIFHMDLKSSNIVLSAEWVPKVCDLGIGVSSEKDFKARNGKSGTSGTPRYMAPECVNDGPVANLQAVDSYGFGWIVHDVSHVGTSPSAQRSADGASPNAAAAPSASSGGSNSEPTGNAVSPISPGDTLSGTYSTPWIGVLVRRSMTKRWASMCRSRWRSSSAHAWRWTLSSDLRWLPRESAWPKPR